MSKTRMQRRQARKTILLLAAFLSLLGLSLGALL